MTDQPDDQRPSRPDPDPGALNFGYRDADGREVSSADATQVVSRAPAPDPSAAPGTAAPEPALSNPGAADRTQVVPRGTPPPVPQQPWGAKPQAAPPQGYAPQWEKSPAPPQGYGRPPQQPGWGPPQGYGRPPQQPGWGPPQGYGRPPQQPGWGQQGQPSALPSSAPMQPGWGRLVVDTSFFPLAFILYLFGPLATVDGQERARTWGRAAVDVPAGPHRVDVLTRYLFPVARASLDVVVQPGQEVPVFYKTPAIIFMSGAIGYVPQPVKGMGLTIAILVVAVLLIVLDVVLAVG